MSSSPINITSSRQQHALHELHDMTELSPVALVLFIVFICWHCLMARSKTKPGNAGLCFYNNFQATLALVEKQ